MGLRRKFLANSDSCVLVYSFQGFQRNPTRRLHLSKRIYLVFMIDCCILHSTLNFSPSIVDSIHNPNWLYNKTPNRQIFFHLTLECQSKQSSGPPWILRFTVTKSFPSLDEDPPTVNVSAETIKARVAAGLILPPSPLISGKFSTQLASFSDSKISGLWFVRFAECLQKVASHRQANQLGILGSYQVLDIERYQ